MGAREATKACLMFVVVCERVRAESAPTRVPRGEKERRASEMICVMEEEEMMLSVDEDARATIVWR